MRRTISLHSESGQALVEFALVLPLFLLMLFMIIDTGWMIYQKGTFEQAVEYAGNSITAAERGDTDPLEEESVVPESVDAATVEAIVAAKIRESALPGFDTSNVTVDNASAEFTNSVKNFHEPGISGMRDGNSVEITRHLHLQAEVTFIYRPMTPPGQFFFGVTKVFRKDIDCEKETGKARRSE